MNGRLLRAHARRALAGDTGHGNHKADGKTPPKRPRSASTDKGNDFHLGAFADQRAFMIMAPNNSAIKFHSHRAGVDVECFEQGAHGYRPWQFPAVTVQQNLHHLI